MTYQETLDYLYNSLPMFHRIGAAALKPSLDNTIALCSILDNPQEKFKSIHIAGTNGKGSSSHMLASILQEAGYNVGLYTSPHLKSFTERIRINGVPITEKRVVDFVRQNKVHFEAIQPSFFEMTVGMAFEYFAEEKIDIAVVEVGLGGRLDSTNIITPILSLITNISFDHEGILGNTLAKIASEKAGIIKPTIPVVVSEYQEEIVDVFEHKAKEGNSRIVHASKEFKLSNIKTSEGQFEAEVEHHGKLLYKNLKIDLPGIYQKHNLLGVLVAIDLLKQQGWIVSDLNVASGLRNVVANTGLKGRWQILGVNPTVVCDTGHNESGINYVVSQLKTMKYEKLHFVLGTVNDKNIDKIIKLLPRNAYYYFTKPNIPRGLDSNTLYLAAQKYDLHGEESPSVSEAIKKAKLNAHPNDLIFIGGSNFVVAEIDEL